MKESINKLMRHPSHESDEVGAVDIYEDSGDLELYRGDDDNY